MLVLKTSSFIITSVGLSSKLRTRRSTVDAHIQDRGPRLSDEEADIEMFLDQQLQGTFPS
jgi:hypothetical protein